MQAKISTSTSISSAGAATAGSIGATRGGGGGKASTAFAAVHALNSANATGTGIHGKRKPEEVLIKATGRAIAKAMNLALFFQQQKDCAVVIRTGSIHAIDDIEVKGSERWDVEVDDEERGEMDVEDRGAELRDGKKDAKPIREKCVKDNVDMEVPETRVRQTSVLEVAVTLR